MLTETELRNFDAFAKSIVRRAAAFPNDFQHCEIQAVAAGTQPIFCLLRSGVTHSRNGEVRPLECRLGGLVVNEQRIEPARQCSDRCSCLIS